jgi:hypothetical protein
MSEVHLRDLTDAPAGPTGDHRFQDRHVGTDDARKGTEMMTRKSTRQYLARTLTLAAFVATFGLATIDHAHAEEIDPSRDATTEIQVCEAMGGHAKVTVDRHGDYLTVYVECKGGALDGFKCINDTGFNDCMFTRLDPDHTISLPTSGGIKPIDDVAVVPINVAEAPTEVAPDVQELPATSTPEPSPIVTVVDPVLSDPVVTDDGSAVTPTPEAGGEIISDPVITDPVVNDGAVAPVDSSDGTIIIDPAPVRDPLKRLPLGGEEIKVAPGQ